MPKNSFGGVQAIWREIKNLPKAQLYALVHDYNRYVVGCDEGQTPVSVPEFYIDDWQEIIEENNIFEG
jgi:hypothetical protein